FVDFVLAQPTHHGLKIDTLARIRQAHHLRIVRSQSRGLFRIGGAGEYPCPRAVEYPCIFVDFETRIDNSLDGWTGGLHVPHVQLRIIRNYRPGPRQHHATTSTPMMAVGTGRRTGYPLGLAVGQSYAAIERS